MQRNYQVHDFTRINAEQLNKRIAFHEAGHATAIYLYNKQRQLPPVYFQITLQKDKPLNRANLLLTPDNIAAKVEGGCLVQNMLLADVDCEKTLSDTERVEYYSALEADIINLLAGAVAEANYVSLTDNEIINAHLLSVDALKNYGSHTDLQRIEEYLNSLVKGSYQQKYKLTKLLIETFEFITKPDIWKAVKAVADFILASNKQTISCEEVFATIDALQFQ